MQYIIDGINDTNEKKNVLYGASTMREFKQKLNVYRVYKSQTQSNVSTPLNVPRPSAAQSFRRTSNNHHQSSSAQPTQQNVANSNATNTNRLTQVSCTY